MSGKFPWSLSNDRLDSLVNQLVVLRLFDKTIYPGTIFDVICGANIDDQRGPKVIWKACLSPDGWFAPSRCSAGARETPLEGTWVGNKPMMLLAWQKQENYDSTIVFMKFLCPENGVVITKTTVVVPFLLSEVGEQDANGLPARTESV